MLRKKTNVKNRIQSLEIMVITSTVLIIIGIICSFVMGSDRNSDNSQQSYSSTLAKSSKARPQDAQTSSYDRLMKAEFKLKFADKTEVIDQKLLSEWVNEEKNSKGRTEYHISEDKLKEYVSGLAKKYNTFKDYITFKTTSGDTIDLVNKSTGWILDEEYAFDAIKDMIKKMNSVSLDLTDESEASNKWWARIASKYTLEEGYGDTYVEVSIDQQHMWMYKDGKLVLESDVVTGEPEEGHETPTGAFVIGYKQKDANLYDTDYLIRVRNWISFYNDVGFHDAEWQTNFGGDVYTYNGSHGCVNMPLEAVDKLYDLTYEGMPVFVY